MTTGVQLMENRGPEGGGLYMDIFIKLEPPYLMIFLSSEGLILVVVTHYHPPCCAGV